MKRSERAKELLKRLPTIYPDAHCELVHSNPLELLVATILSAQCTDKRVNLVTRELFQRCHTAQDYAAISQEELEGLVRSTGFYRNKTTSLIRLGQELVERFGMGDVEPPASGHQEFAAHGWFAVIDGHGGTGLRQGLRRHQSRRSAADNCHFHGADHTCMKRA
jgi:endonuclease III-like uncharacterized protein